MALFGPGVTLVTIAKIAKAVSVSIDMRVGSRYHEVASRPGDDRGAVLA